MPLTESVARTVSIVFGENAATSPGLLRMIPTPSGVNKFFTVFEFRIAVRTSGDKICVKSALFLRFSAVVRAARGSALSKADIVSGVTYEN